MKKPEDEFEKALNFVGIYAETDSHLIKQLRKGVAKWLSTKRQTLPHKVKLCDDCASVAAYLDRLLEELEK